MSPAVGADGHEVGAARPLEGLVVAVTRAAGQAGELTSRLEQLGATAVDVPTIAIEDPADGGAALRGSLGSLEPGDWLVVTSPNGASRVVAALDEARHALRARLAAIGPGTAAVLASAGLTADLVPDHAVAEDLLAALGPPPLDGPRRVVIARAEVGRDVLPSGLADAGWDVEVVVAYRTVAATPGPDAARALAGADVVTFLSSSAVERFVEIYGLSSLAPVVATIGPVTTATASRLGVGVEVEADPHTIDGLLAAMTDWAATR